MSDDRFKQARRSLIDRHNQRQQDNFGDDFEDEATAMVDLDSVERQGGFPPPPGYQPPAQAPAPQQGSFPPPPSYQQGGPSASGNIPSHAPPPNFSNSAPGDEATEMFSVNAYEASKPLPSPQSAPGVQMGGVQMGASSASGSAQVVIGDDVGYEGSTQFINIAELAAEGGQSVAPDDHAVGYEGSTQFVDLNALQAEGPHTEMSVANDPELNQAYRFSPDSIQEGEFTLIFAQNAMGVPVVLKRIWEGDATTMPFELRQRLAALDPIRHPRLVALNGVLTTQSGAWVELARPGGYRLTDILAQNGPQAVESVKIWLQQIAEVLTVVHQFQFVYANLTTDAIWVQDDGSVFVEPFDILTFENRGDLGLYGPPELSQPPDSRIVSPSTDVYSMAAVAVAALSGLPLNLQNAQAVDSSVGGPSMSALSHNPAERPPTPLDFAQMVGGTAGKKGKLPDINIKIVIAGVLVVGILVVGGLFMKKQSDAAAAAAAAAADAVAAEKVEPDPDPDAERKPVGDLEVDERLSIATSFASNPSREAAVVSLLSPEELETLREEAKEAVKGVERLTERAQSERYEMALKKMAELQRGAGGKLEPEDQEFLADLLSNSRVKKLRKENLDQVNDALKAKKLTSAKLFYQQVESIDGEANARGFFGNNKSAKISKVIRTGTARTIDKKAAEKGK